jgi:hypothetical protein
MLFSSRHRHFRQRSGKSTPALSSDDWAAEWQSWGASRRNLLPGIQIDDSRESIYTGRGE